MSGGIPPGDKLTVWAHTEGMHWHPLLCTDRDLATTLAADLQLTRIATTNVATCCHACQPGELGCIRDHFDDPDDERPVEIIMRAAMARGIVWPADQGRTESETSTL